MSIGGIRGGDAWRPRSISEIKKDLNALAPGQDYVTKEADTIWNIAASLKGNNRAIELNTAALAAQLQHQLNVADPKTLSVGANLDITEYSPKGKTSFNAPVKFAEATPEKYVPDTVNYMKKFIDTDKNAKMPNADKTFSAKELSQAYGIKMTDKMMKNLDLDGKDGIDLKEASLGLMMADYSNNGPNSKPDGVVSKAESKNFQSLLKTPVEREAQLEKMYKKSQASGADSGTLQKIQDEKEKLYDANKDTLKQIERSVDYRGKLTEAVKKAQD